MSSNAAISTVSRVATIASKIERISLGGRKLALLPSNSGNPLVLISTILLAVSFPKPNRKWPPRFQQRSTLSRLPLPRVTRRPSSSFCGRNVQRSLLASNSDSSFGSGPAFFLL